MASPQPTVIIERLIDDDYVHDQLVAGGARLRDAYRRARHLPGHKAVQDPTIYDNLRGAVAAVIAAVRRLVGKPKSEPEPPPRRGRRPFLLLALVISGAALYFARRADQAQPHAQSVGADAAHRNPAPSPTTPPRIQ
jgi:hypothetical protein